MQRIIARAGRLARFLFLAALPALPQTVWPVSPTTIIDAGSATDANFTGGAVFTIAGTTASGDSTLRYGASFSYSLPVDNVPYVVTFRFVEPCAAGAGCGAVVNGPGQRLFTVTANGQTILQDLDLYAASGGALVPLSRSVVVMGADGKLNLKFSATGGNHNTAVVSAIEIYALAGIVQTASSRQIIWYEYVPTRQADGSYVSYGPPLAMGTVVWQGPNVFRNGARQLSPAAYSVTTNSPFVFVPTPGWDPSDKVLVEYWVVVNGGPTVGSPSIPSQ
jgi:hypothetical protein